MSNIYIKEPPTLGKVLLHTSLGDLDVELWSKEAPLACRNFVQLALEGYYDNLTFHRIVKDFMIQGGDPTGTGEGGESIYGKPFKDEFHQRLRFVRRGLVAMANAGPNDNGSQFFITLGPCNDLNKKHTIFAKIGGDTIYNLVRLGDVETDDNEKPHNPPVIKWAKVLANPFDDIVVREKKKPKKAKKEKKERQVKATKNFKLLSFGDEAEEEEQETMMLDAAAPVKGKSSHDIGNDPTLSSKTFEEEFPSEKDTNNEVDYNPSNKKQKLDTIRDKLKSKTKEEKSNRTEEKTLNEEDAIKKLQKESKRVAKEILKSKNKSEASSKNDEKDATDKEEKEEKTEKDNSIYGQHRKQVKAFKKQAKMDKRLQADREKDTMASMQSFLSKLQRASSFLKKDEETEENASDAPKIPAEKLWFAKKFKSEEDELRDAKDMNREVTEDRFDLFDPRNPLNKRKREKKHSKSKKHKM